MSIIFQKLKNLRKKPLKQEKGFPTLQKGGNVYTFRRLLFSPTGVLISVLSIVGFGILSFFALSFLKDYLDSGSSNAIVVQHLPSDTLPGTGIPIEIDDVPGDPANSPNPGADPGDRPAQKAPEKFKVPDYFVQQVKNEASQYQKKPDQAEPDQAKPGPAKDGLKIPDASDPMSGPGLKNRFLPAGKSEYKTLLKKPPLAHLSPAVATLNPDTVLTPKKDMPEPSNAYTMPPVPSQGSQKKIGSEKQSKKISRTSPGKTMSAETKAAAKKEVIRLAKQKRTKKVSAIATLATELTTAMEENDHDRTDLLFEKLSEIQNNNSSYYIKLKAFKEIRQENYDPAKRLLNKILAKDKTDFEAGINMAIIEIREEKFSMAKQRLIRLKAYYPFQSAIDDLLDLL